ncbi:MAG: hypothetical protein HBSIN02_20300 [Bacteroidia bacterium]|nr:MAG: hypothetical protein HBSIN02_20300 [Bacteroidia bacterium]
MGGVSIALEDSLADPFVNPAAGSLVKGVRASTSPMMYGVGFESGARSTVNTTIPIGVVLGGERYFGGLTWARQVLSSKEQVSFPIPFSLPWGQTSGESNSNTYTFWMAGMNIPGTAFSVGLSAFWADLNAVDGVQYLYSTRDELTQRGSIATYRLGFKGSWDGGRSFEAVLAHQVTDMRHLLSTSTVGPWMPFDNSITLPTLRAEEDKTLAYGLHLEYSQPLNAVWRIGGILTGTIKTHPKIPNYELMNIPRDPGNSTAWNVGIGLSSKGSSAMFGIDVVYEPVKSETWAEEEVLVMPVEEMYGDFAPVTRTMRTIENFFEFSNYHLRFGVQSLVRDFGVGLHFHRISYDMKQADHRAGSIRRQKESWTEITFSVGFGFAFWGGQVKYLGLADFGTGRPGLGGGIVPTAGFDLATDFLVAPQSAIVVDNAVILTHQISFIIQLD